MTNRAFVVRHGLAVNTNSTNTAATIQGGMEIYDSLGISNSVSASAEKFRAYSSAASANLALFSGATLGLLVAANSTYTSLNSTEDDGTGLQPMRLSASNFQFGNTTANYFSTSSGSVTFSNPAFVQEGSVSAPGLSFPGWATTGIYSPTGHQLGITVSSSNVMIANTSGVYWSNTTSQTGFFAANGNFGFGTIAPGNRVTIANSSGQVYSNWTNGTGNLLAGINGSHDAVFGTTSVSALYLYTNNTIKGVITAGGNVGISNTAPALTLHVGGSSASNIGTLSDAANIAVNLGTYNNWTVTLGGNRNIDNPTGLVPGQSGIVFIIQDSTGSRTATWSSYWKFPGGTAPTLSTTANTVDAVMYTVRSSTSILAKELLNIEVI